MRRRAICVAGAFLFLGLGMLGSSPVMVALDPSRAEAVDCEQVRGHLDELPLVPCASPVGLCTTAQMNGSIHGDAIFTAATITSSTDFPLTGVVFVTGDTAIEDAQVAGHRGRIAIKNAAAFRTTGGNDLVDVQTIIGGTGDFAGATGSLRISGDFVPGIGGSSTYEGVVCFP